jgi:hypothetical protein
MSREKGDFRCTRCATAKPNAGMLHAGTVFPTAAQRTDTVSSRGPPTKGDRITPVGRIRRRVCSVAEGSAPYVNHRDLARGVGKMARVPVVPRAVELWKCAKVFRPKSAKLADLDEWRKPLFFKWMRRQRRKSAKPAPRHGRGRSSTKSDAPDN